MCGIPKLIRVQTTVPPGLCGRSELTHTLLPGTVIPGFLTLGATEIADTGQVLPDGLEPTSFLLQSCMSVVHINVRSVWGRSPKKVTVYPKVLDLEKSK